MRNTRLPLRLLLAVVIVLLVTSVVNTTRAQGQTHDLSYYVPMPDGTQIAIEVYLPGSAAPTDPLPTMLQATRYWRAIPGQPLNPEITAFNAAGYAIVIADARGSGASTGTRTMEWSKAEVEDYRTVIDWIVAQPWSNGKVGTWGVSYPGTTAELIAALQHPAVKIVAPLYDDFDPLIHLVQVNGVFNETFIKEWGKMVKAMDRNDLCTVTKVDAAQCALLKLLTPGVAPVTSDKDGKILSQALKDHEGNLDVFAAAKQSEFRDSIFGPSATLASVSPYALRGAIEGSKLPMIVWAGWLDAATVEGTLARYRTFSNPQQVVIGPLSHGGLHDTDPFNPADTAVTPSPAEQFTQRLAILDGYLKGDNPPPLKTGITYYTMNSGKWTTTDIFPPKEFTPKAWYFGPDGTLVPDAPTVSSASDTYKVDFTTSTGATNRWSTQIDGGDVVYPDRAQEDKKLLTYTSQPLTTDVEITGNPELGLYVASTETDGAIFAYLEAVAPDGNVTYITEGMLRLSQRKLSTDPAPYTTVGPQRSFLAKDALPMKPGEVAEVRFNLFATSVLLHKGDRLRMAIAGADAADFARYPASGDPVLTVQRSVSAPSQVILPMVTR